MKLPILFDDPTALKTYPAGTTLFTEGDPGEFMYVVKSGEIDIDIHGKIVDTVGEQSIVGELALLDSVPHSATAITKTECVLLPINQKQFLFMLEETPFFAIEVMRIMASRLRHKHAE